MKKKLMYFKPFPVCGNYGMEIRGIHGNFQNSGFHGNLEKYDWKDKKKKQFMYLKIDINIVNMW